MDVPVIIHIAGGLVSIIAGTVAVSTSKGSEPHKKAGLFFVVAMLVMAIPAGLISWLNDKSFDVLSSFLTCYMIFTGMLAFRPGLRKMSVALACIAAFCIAGYLAAELLTATTGIRNTDAPVGAGYVFAALMGIALLGDIRKLKTPLSRKHQTIRHLWRMNAGFFMATGNLFGVRPYLFPEWMQSSGLLILLALAPVLVILYSLVRIGWNPSRYARVGKS